MIHLASCSQSQTFLDLKESLQEPQILSGFSLGSCQHLEVSYTAENLCVLSPDKHSHSSWLTLTHMHSCLKHLCPAEHSFDTIHAHTPIRYLLQQWTDKLQKKIRDTYSEQKTKIDRVKWNKGVPWPMSQGCQFSHLLPSRRATSGVGAQ